MKTLHYIWILLAFAGCREADQLLFDSSARVQMGERDDLSFSFFKAPESKLLDTVYLNVVVIGNLEDRVRHLDFEQVTEYDVTYKYDNKGAIVDSVLTEITNPGVAGVDYVAMDDPSIQPLLVVQPNAVAAKVPIILKRTATLKQKELRIRLRLKENNDFLCGEKQRLSRTIIISDRRQKPTEWPDRFFGNYGLAKHEFMVAVAGEEIDNAWIVRVINSDSGKLWRGKFYGALMAYNEDPANIASGKAPMRENPDDPNSPVMDF